MEKNNKKKRMIILSACVLTMILVGILGTYAFFLTDVNNTNNQKAQIDTGTMRLRFADNDATINERLMLGEDVTKKFTLENTGSLDAVVSIEWLDLINTYLDGSLTYTLEYSETENGTYTKLITDEKVPTTSTAFTTTLVPDITIPTGKTYYYNLIITLNNLTDIDQTSDASAILSTKFTISQPSTNRSYTLVVDPNGGILGDSNTVQTYTLKSGATQNIGTPSNGGKVFKGWIISGYGSTLTDGILTLGKTNTKLVAKWEEFNAVEAVISISNDQIPKGVHDNTPNYDLPATTDEGVYKLTDDYGTSYYYRGAVTNNYVKFGKNKDGADMYWRIIRINGDGSVRIRYDGTQAYANGTNTAERFTHTEKVWNTLSGDAKYVGWMYGPSGTTASSNKEEAQTNTESVELKKLVDAWYKENIVDTGYGIKVADSIFCNDRSTPGQSITEWLSDTGKGFAKNATGYGAHGRFATGNEFFNGGARENIKPIFTCPQKNDAFTVDDEVKGNGDLIYPVGLITADEIVTAGGGKYRTNNMYYYLYNNIWSWALSPFCMHTNGFTYTFRIDIYGDSHAAYVSDTGAVAPVINLKSEYVKTMIGDGTMSDPFRAPGITP